LEIESEFRGLLEQLSLFYYLFIEIKSKFRALLELLLGGKEVRAKNCPTN
jgi:hypothetical protein